MFRFVFICFITSLSFNTFSQQLIINEISQGSGSSEYVEFVVIGTPTCVTPVPCIDLRRVIFDDNNGYFASGSGTGIASGAVRFADISFWQCIPQGTFIVIYNNSSPNSSLPPDDLSMSDGNCRLIIPASSNLLEKTNVSPTTSILTYPPNSDWTTGGSWTPLSMNNNDDSFQIPNLSNNGVPLHSVSWGNNTSGTIIYFAGAASNKVFSFTNNVSNDWNNQANWSSGTVPTNETPGAPNNSQNDAWIATMNPQCSVNPGMTINIASTNESCINTCDGSANTSVSNGNAPYTYNWSNGQTTSTVSNLCPGNYTVEVTSSTGCTAINSVTILQGTSISDATIQNSGPFIITDSPQQMNSINSGGTWSSNCGSCLSSTGIFNPQTAGIGTWLICYQLGSGTCSDSKCISITVSQGCPPQLTTETQSICEGDSLLIFGNWELNAGNYSQSFFDLNGCDSTHTVSLSYFSSNDINESIKICEFDSTFVFGSWYFESQVISQSIQTSNGCFYMHTITVIQENCIVEPSALYIPNVFTPNGDLLNDVFKIEIVGGEIEEGFIFNRWGNIVFKFDPHTLEWDGRDEKSGNLVQDGVYTYVVYFKPAEGARVLHHGFVTLIR